MSMSLSLFSTPIFSLVIWSQPAWAQAEASEVNSGTLIGSWRFDPATGRFPQIAPGPSIVGRTETYRVIDGDQIELVGETTFSDGSTAQGRLTWSSRGGLVTEEPDTSNRMIVETLVSPGHWWATFMVNGVQAMVMEKVVSADGEIMRQVFRGTNEKGDPVEATAVFHRQ